MRPRPAGALYLFPGALPGGLLLGALPGGLLRGALPGGAEFAELGADLVGVRMMQAVQQVRGLAPGVPKARGRPGGAAFAGDGSGQADHADGGQRPAGNVKRCGGTTSPTSSWMSAWGVSLIERGSPENRLPSVRP